MIEYSCPLDQMCSRLLKSVETVTVCLALGKIGVDRGPPLLRASAWTRPVSRNSRKIGTSKSVLEL